MTVFRKSVSWSKFSLALSCPLRLQKTIDKEFSPKFGISSDAAAKGKLVQKVFELYFNNDLNLSSKGQYTTILVKILDKVMASPWAEKEGVASDMREAVIPQLEQGLKIFKSEKMLGHRIRSEVELKVAFDGFRMFGMLDFLMETQLGVGIFDGKGYKEKNADPRQVLYYALMLHASRRHVIKGGFIYWKHDYHDIPVDAKSLYDFVHGDFVRGRKVFDKLAAGVDKLTPNPTPEVCGYCLWGKTCEFSAAKKEPGEVFIGVQEVGFGGGV